MTDFYTDVHQYKRHLLVTGYEDGKRFLRRVEYKPYLYVTDREGRSDMHSVYGEAVQRIDFDNMYEVKDFVEQYKNVQGFTIHGLSNWPMLYIHDEYPTNEFDQSLIRVCPIDIEVDISEKYPNIEKGDCAITAVTIGRNIDGVEQYDTFGVKDFDTSEFPDVVYHKCTDEKNLLSRFLDMYNSAKYSPDVITGWNVNLFDVPYLIARIRRVLNDDFANRLSPWKILSSRTAEIYGRQQTIYSPVGVDILDYMDLYKKFTIPMQGQQESYALNYICQVELGETKLDYSEYANLTELYENNPQKYYEYNVRDVRLIFKLDNKLDLISLAIIMAYEAGVNYSAIFGTIQQWDATIHKYLRQRNFVVPFIMGGNEGGKIEGAHVKNPIPGLYRWPVSFDFASLYPKTIQQYNISPEKFYDLIPGCSPQKFLNREIDTKGLCGDDFTVTGNGCRFYRKEQGFLAALMELIFDQRAIYKGKMIDASRQLEKTTDPKEITRLKNEVSKWNNFQHAMKIKLNGLYGSLANRFNRWNDPRFAEAITLSGQLAFGTAEKAVNQYLNSQLKTQDHDYVIAGDTDSLYIELGSLVDRVFEDQTDMTKIVDFIDKVAKEKIQPVINKACEDLATYMHCRENCMDMKRETIGNKAIWTGKKHYIVNVYDEEGVRFAEPKKKIKGLEAVKSSTPSAARQGIKDAIDIILNQEQSDLHTFVDQLRQKYKDLPLDEISFNRGVSDLNKWRCSSGFLSSTPIHVKASMIYNRILSDKKIKKYPFIQSGEKIKFVYLNEQNHYFADVIGFIGILPPEFGLNDYVDRMKQFKKGFVNPLQGITDAIGWTTEHVPTLDAFITYVEEAA